MAWKIQQKNQTRIIIIFMVVFVLIVLHFFGVLRPVEDGVMYVIRPVFKTTTGAAQSASSSFGLLGSIGDLASENNDLRQELEVLEADIAQLNELKKENDALREQLKFSKRQDFELEPTFIIGYDPTSFTEYLTIDKGSESGIGEDDPVITESGILIGRIAEVGWKTSKILLTIDSSSKINAVVQDSRASGIVNGEHGLGLVMDLIPQDKVIKQGDTVVTSGLGATFPKGLIIGKIETMSQSKNELFQMARVKPITSFRDIEIAFVIKEF
ncbi:rod shape-determining protein MreC [Patescibacteria group bacterium]